MEWTPVTIQPHLGSHPEGNSLLAAGSGIIPDIRRGIN